MISITTATPSDAPEIDRLAELTGLQVDAAHSLGLSYAWLACARAPGGDFLGFIIAWRVADEFELLDLATDPGQRRRGVASALLGELIHAAQVRAGRAVFLEVRSSNQPARALYEKHGFQVVHERKNYYRDPVENALCMRLDLASTKPPGPLP